MCTYFKLKTDSSKSDRWFCFLILTVRGAFHRMDFKWKKYGGTGLISEETEVLRAELAKLREQPPVVIP